MTANTGETHSELVVYIVLSRPLLLFTSSTMQILADFNKCNMMSKSVIWCQRLHSRIETG